MISVLPLSLQSRMRMSMTFALFAASSEPVGSSARMIGWSQTIARAIATRCRSPPDNLPALRFSLSDMSSFCAISLIRGLCSLRLICLL